MIFFFFSSLSFHSIYMYNSLTLSQEAHFQALYYNLDTLQRSLKCLLLSCPAGPAHFNSTFLKE